MRILEDLWYGNIEPTEYDTYPCAEYKVALQWISRKEEKLKPEGRKAQGHHDGFTEGAILAVLGQCTGISGYGRMHAVPE